MKNLKFHLSFYINFGCLSHKTGHLAAAVTNLFYVESVWPEWHDRNKLFFDDPLSVVNGHITPPDLPGLGLQFKKGLFGQSDVIVEKIA